MLLGAEVELVESGATRVGASEPSRALAPLSLPAGPNPDAIPFLVPGRGEGLAWRDEVPSRRPPPLRSLRPPMALSPAALLRVESGPPRAGPFPTATAICPTHGLRFDPSQAGCIRCRASSVAPSSPPSSNRRAVLLGGGLRAGLGVADIFILGLHTARLCRRGRIVSQTGPVESCGSRATRKDGKNMTLSDEELRGVWAGSAPRVTSEALDAADVARVEARIGGKLPRDYLALLGVQNGGYVRRPFHPKVNGEVAEIRGIGKAPRNLEAYDWSEVLAYMEEEGVTEPSGLERMVPFSGGGHYFTCFDYNCLVGGEPSIAFVDVELFEPTVLVGRRGPVTRRGGAHHSR